MAAIHIHKDNKEIVDLIVKEIGFKNQGEAVNAVLRRFGPQYLNGNSTPMVSIPSSQTSMTHFPSTPNGASYIKPNKSEALNELDDLLGL